MSQNGVLKVGLISTLSPELNDVWGEEVQSRARARMMGARATLEALGAQVFDPGELTTDSHTAARHGRLLRDQGIHVLVVYVGMWSYGSAAVAAAAECGTPAIVWTDTQVRYVGIVGASVARGSLEEAGIPNSLVYGEMEDPETQRELAVRVLGAAAATRLRGLTYGLMGSRSLGMYTAAVDSTYWRRAFGVEVEAWDQLEAIEAARSLPDTAVDEQLAWTRREFGPIQVSEEVMRAALKLYVASKEIIARRGFDFVSVRCLPETPTAYTTFCYTIALLNDTSDAGGPKDATVCACESDSNGALTMQILKHLGGAPVLMGDVRTVNLEQREVWISNCGAQATELAPSRKEVHWVEHGFQEYKWKIGAAAPQAISKPGRVTIARLTRVAGEYVMLVTGGECLAEPRAKLDETYWGFSPHSFVRLDADARRFAQELRCNHLHMIYGDYVPHLAETCRILGIRPIVV